MPLPKDVSITEVAGVLQLTKEEVGQLSPRAQQLTKGDMLALLGADTEAEAVTVFVMTGGAALLPRPKITEAVGELTVTDRASLTAAFGRWQKEALSRVRIGANISDVTTEAIDIGIQIQNCCCCPCTCCCAASVAQPARIA
jgi:hypothetical protein